MNCPKCKAEIPDRFKFCPECGTSVSGISVESEQEHTKGCEGQSAPGDLSVGDMRTMQPAPGVEPPDLSLGDLKTMTGPGGGESAASLQRNTPLSERYELLEEIGRGGFAKVWKARDKRLDRLVAVKRLLDGKLEGPMGRQTLERFEREATAIAQLNHRNIVMVHDHDADAEGHYIVMELVAGGTLRDHLKTHGGKLTVAGAVELVKGIAQGLGYAHRKNLVHRDIKPANVLLQKDGDELTPKIVDFGLARLGSESELSVSGYGMGTPWYMPPEQRRNAKGVNHTADIYALGKVLYEMVTGEIPDNVDPEQIPAVNGLSEIIFKCIKSNPEDRYFSAAEVLKALDALGSLGARRAMQGAVGENPCPSCSATNTIDAKFCESCGAGLTRPCPECERENSIHKQFCGGCGTDVEGVLQLREALPRLEKHAADKRWSRVVKEYDLLPKESKLTGQKGKTLRQKVNALNDDAKNRLARIEALKAEADRAASSDAWVEREKALAEYIELYPHDENASIALKETRGKIDEEDWAQTHSAARQYENHLHFQRALAAYDGYLKDHSTGKHADEAIQNGLFQRKLVVMDKLRRKYMRAGNFDGVTELVGQMELFLKGHSAALLLYRENDEQRLAYETAVEHARQLVKNRKLAEAVEAWKEIKSRWPDSEEINVEVKSMQ
jgi:serine/threonine protein kinase